MRIVVQRVKNASCHIDNKLISSIDNGFLVLVGFTHEDTTKDVLQLAKKIAHLRIFDDENGKMNIDINSCGYEILSISQFTLYGDASKGNRPSFTKAMTPKHALQLYNLFNTTLKNTYQIPTKEGVFGAHMDITLHNDGPVTLVLESSRK